jgi:nucleoside-diphosphate-sugar epimerase
MDVVFHVAAMTGIWGKRKAFRDINVSGTKNVIAGCRTHGVGRLVYTSSPSVVFGEDDLCGVDESQPYPDRYLGHYPATKAAAERAVLDTNASKLATVALRPHLIFGPGDPHLIPRVIARARQGRLIQVGDGKNLVDITYIDNAAEAHLQAAEALAGVAACAGRAYFISQGEPVLLWPWLNGLLTAIGAPRTTRSISYRRAYHAGALLEALHRVFSVKREPRLTRFLAAQLSKTHYFDISAARRDFGYQPRIDNEEGLRRLIEWVRGLVGPEPRDPAAT